jgi:hypothetical protein
MFIFKFSIQIFMAYGMKIYKNLVWFSNIFKFVACIFIYNFIVLLCL